MPPRKTSKGKKKKKKGSKKSKQPVIILGPDGLPIYTPQQKHDMFVDKVNSWLRVNCGQLIDLLQYCDNKGSGWVSQENFKIALTTLKAPITEPEIALITKHLTDVQASDSINYLVFAKGVKIPLPPKKEVITDEVKFTVRDTTLPPCNTCKLKFPRTQYSEIRPRYVKLTLELHQFVEKSLPCNFTTVVTSSLSIYGIKQLIQQRHGHSIIILEVYRTKQHDEVLANNWTLQDIGYQGWSEEEPEEVTLYYDLHVTSAVYSCPLLLTDHYFAKHDRPPSPCKPYYNPNQSGNLIAPIMVQSQLTLTLPSTSQLTTSNASTKTLLTASPSTHKLPLSSLPKSQLIVGSGLK